MSESAAALPRWSTSPSVMPADQVFDLMAKRQMADLRLGLSAKISEDKDQAHRLTVLQRDLDKEMHMLRGIAEAFDAHASPDKGHVAHVTSRCLALRAGLIHKSGEELDRGTALLVEERERQADMRQHAEQHGSVVHETLALLASYHAEVSASLDAKCEALQIEKRCLVQGLTPAAALLGPTEVDARGKPSPSRNPPNPPPGLQRALSYRAREVPLESTGGRTVGHTASPQPLEGGGGPTFSPPLSPTKGRLAYRDYSSYGSPPVSPTKRGSFAVGYAPYMPTYVPPPLVPGRPRTPATWSSSASSSPRRPPSPKHRASAANADGCNYSSDGPHSGTSDSPVGVGSDSAAGGTAQNSAAATRIESRQLSRGETLTGQKMQHLHAAAEQKGAHGFGSPPAASRAANAPAASATGASAATPGEETGRVAMPGGGASAMAEDTPARAISFDVQLAAQGSEIDLPEPEMESAGRSETEVAPPERRRSLTDMRLDTAQGALHRTRMWRMDMQSKLSDFENEVRNDFLATTGAVKSAIRDGEKRLAQVNSRKLYVEQQRNKTLLQQRRLQQSIAEKQLHLATLGSNLQALSRRRMVAEDDDAEGFVMHQLSEMQGIVGAIDAEILSTQVEVETLDGNHADLSSVEAALKHLLDLDGQCLRLRQDHKARPQVAVPQALR